MATNFLYFDLGNVLLTFSNEQACRQMAELAGVEFEQVAKLVLGPNERDSLLWKFEHGVIGEDAFFAQLVDGLGAAPDRSQMERAASDMFAPIAASFQLVEQLRSTGHRLGILSNTNPVHWRFLTDGRWPLLNSAFDEHVTSFHAQSMKPDQRIYDHAIAKAGVPADEIFFVDDRVENVAGAVAAGIDAVQYVDHQKLVDDLRARGIEVTS